MIPGLSFKPADRLLWDGLSGLHICRLEMTGGEETPVLRRGGLGEVCAPPVLTTRV